MLHEPDAIRRAAREVVVERIGEGCARAAVVFDERGRIAVEVGDCEGIDTTE